MTGPVVQNYLISYDIRPVEDEEFWKAVHGLLDPIPPAEVSPEHLEDLERRLCQRWPDARIAHAWSRPTDRPGRIVWTAWREGRFADPERVGMFAPPER